MTQKALVEAACREVRCSFCNAEPSKPCTTLTSGFGRREVHAGRFHEAVRAGRVQYRAGGGFEVMPADGETK